ncbi:MAG TPA: D-hexose-6-phosphate mutarotase [Methylomirabilota bacterium]|nr:D-hexose-6-phosphate mutarotase [Methylomirabilota bacterium]
MGAESVVVESGAGGLPRARLTGARAEGEVYLHGGHVTRWQPRGAAPVLFLSTRATYAPGKAIRGGVPVIFPWFGPHPTDRRAPMHGFARARPWRLVAGGPESTGSVALELALEDDAATRALWPSAFSLRYRVRAGDALELALEVVNTSPGPFTFEAALHTYLAVGDIRAVGITGLEHTTYIDKVDGMARKRHGAEPLRITGETDRVFLGTRARCLVDDRALDRRLSVDKTGSATTVVWNPWATKAAGIADLEPDDWRRMVCVETANAADDAVTLPAGGRHVMTATLRVEAAA